MATNKKTLESTAARDESQPALNDRQRAERVLVSQGRAKGLLDSLGEPALKRLAEFCSPAGVVAPAAVGGVRDILVDFYGAQKAVVAEDEQNSRGGEE